MRKITISYVVVAHVSETTGLLCLKIFHDSQWENGAEFDKNAVQHLFSDLFLEIADVQSGIITIVGLLGRDIGEHFFYQFR